LKAKEKLHQTNEMIKALLEVVSSNYLIKQGFPAIVQDDQIVMRSIYGLNVFLLSWIEEEGDNEFLMFEISKFLENFRDYIDYSKLILKFIHDKGPIPEKDEAWELNIPIDEMKYITKIMIKRQSENIIIEGLKKQIKIAYLSRNFSLMGEIFKTISGIYTNNLNEMRKNRGKETGFLKWENNQLLNLHSQILNLRSRLRSISLKEE